MCDGGVFSVPIAMAVVGAGVAVHQGRQQAKAIAEQQQDRQKQIDAASQQQTNDRMAEGRRLRAAARAAAAEAAVSGNSLFAIESDIEAQTGRDVALIESNRKSGIESSLSETQSSLRSTRAEAISGAVGSAASGAQGAYSNYTIQKYGGS